MAQRCKYSRNSLTTGIQGTITFLNVSENVTFFMNDVALTSSYAITLNNSSFLNGSANPLNSSFIRFPVLFTITGIPQNAEISVTSGGTNQINVVCQPQISCDFTYEDNVGTYIKGDFTATDTNIPITFQPNGSSIVGAPYQIILNKLKFTNGKTYGNLSNKYTLETSEIPIRNMYINNFLCTNVDEPYETDAVDDSTFRSEPWFWDLIIVLILGMIWAWFYFYTIKPRGKGFHFKFLEKKKVLTSSVN